MTEKPLLCLRQFWQTFVQKYSLVLGSVRIRLVLMNLVLDTLLLRLEVVPLVVDVFWH